MPSFVVLSHTFSKAQSGRDHLDLMIESDGQLLTWRINYWPPSFDKQYAVELPPHRLVYLDYEGPVSGDRGTVRRVASGSCQIVGRDNSGLEVYINSDIVSGLLKIRRDLDGHHSVGESSDAWLLWMSSDDVAANKAN